MPYHSDAEKATAEQVIADLNGEVFWSAPVVTQVEPLEASYPGEDYYQEYVARSPNQPYYRVVMAPKGFCCG